MSFTFLSNNGNVRRGRRINISQIFRAPAGGGGGGGGTAVLSWQSTDTSGVVSSSSGTNNVWTNNNNNSYANTRAELPTSGYWYFEVHTSGTIDNNASLGLMSMNGNNILDSAHWDSSNCTHRLIRRGNATGSAFQESDNGDGSLSGSNLTNHTSVSWTTDPVVFMVAWDGTNKKAWMGINGTWINSDTPSTNGNGSQNWSAVTGGRVGIAASAYTATCSFTIKGASGHTYSPPSGFTAGGT